MKRRNKTILFILLAISILALALYFWLFSFGLFEHIVVRLLNDQIGKNLGVRFQLDEISGDYFSAPVVRNLNIIYIDDIESYTLAHIPRLTAEYSIKKIWRGEFEFNEVVIDSAVFTLQKTDERWLLPTPVKSSDQKGVSIDFQILEFCLNNLKLNIISPEDSLIIDDIIFDARIKAREKTYSAIIDRLSYRSSDSRFSLLSAGGTVTSTGNQLIFRDFKIITDSSDFKVGGLIVLKKEPNINIDLDAKNINLKELSSFINAKLNGNISAVGNIDYKSGELSGDVIVSGTFFDRYYDSLSTSFHFVNNQFFFDTISGYVFKGCHIDAHGDLDLSRIPAEYHLIGEIRNFNLNNLAYNTYTSNINGRINLTGRGLKSDELELNIVTELDESWFDEYHSSLAIGEMTIFSDSILFHDKFVVKYHDNRFIVSGKLDYHGAIDIAGTTRFDDLSAFNGQTFIERMGGRANLDFNVGGELSNPDITGCFLSDSLWLYDIFSEKADMDFYIKHFLYNRLGKINLYLYNGTAYDIPYDSILLKIDIDSQYALINDVSLGNEYVNLTAAASLNYSSYPQRLILDSININLMDLLFKNDDQVVVEIDSSGYEVIKCRLLRPKGYVEGKGRINYDDSMDFRVFGYRVNIAPWVKLYYDEGDIGGFLSGEVSISGNFHSPLIDFNGGIDSLMYMNFILGDITADYNYSDKLVQINNVSLKSKNGNYVANGIFPIDLTFTAVPDRFHQTREQDIRIIAHDQRLDLISLLIDEVEDFTGEFNADFRLTGTARKPEINGLASVNRGRLKLYDLILPLEDLSIDMTMKNKTVHFNNMSAVCKDNRGRVKGGGTVVINSIDQLDYNLNVDVHEFPAKYELGDISGIIDANLAVKGTTPPTVSGDVTVISANYRENFADENDGWILLSSFQKQDSWNINLNVEIASNLWIKNDDIDAEIAGDINFVRENGRFRYFGTMEILRGKAYWADRNFRIEPGAIISYEDIEYPNPRLDIWASTNIRTATENLFGEIEIANEDLRVHVGGTLDEPIITADEDSPVGTTGILPVLLLNYNPSDTAGKMEPGDRVTSGVSNFISQQVGRLGSRYIGVETLEIDPVYGDKFDPLGTRLTLGKYLGPFYVYGRTAISLEAGQEVGLEYRLKRFLLIDGHMDEDNLYRLNLNFNWNY